MAFIDQDDYWAHLIVGTCPACGGDTSNLDEHANYHNGLYARFFEWPEMVYEDILDADLISDV